MITDFLREIVRCPACMATGKFSGRELARAGTGLRCATCGRHYAALSNEGYLDLRPPAGTFGELTDYAEEDFHHRPGGLRPLFLSARVKMDMMTKLLDPSPEDRILDIGCGNGRFVYFQRERCGKIVGIDAGDHFAAEPLASVDLARGDIRLLPFADASFDKAFSLDVLEHLTEAGVLAMLTEARRVLRTGGKLFLYSHVMMSSRLAVFQRAVNRTVAWLDRHDLVDNAPERERKSDHRNALRSYEQLGGMLARTGFEIETIRYYNVFFKALIEDLMLPLVEHNLYGHSRRATGARARTGSREPPEHDSHHASTRPDVGRWAHPPLTLASHLMKLDVALFGRVRTGPFFLLLRAV